jgi:hypothetical protein
MAKVRKIKGILSRQSVKDLVAKVEVGTDFYTVRWKDKAKAKGKIEKGGRTHLYFEDHNNMVDILLKLGNKYVNELIPAQAIANELVKLHPELSTKMLRPTSKYGKYYYVSLHVENYLKRIIYFHRGEVFLNDKFYEEHKKGVLERPKGGLEKWL